MGDALILDGSHGEGGGQILRTALTLSVLTGRAFRLLNVRARRRKPGLLPQQLTAVRAAAEISGASVSGDELGSSELEFTPTRAPASGDYLFDVAETADQGSAGSVTLVLQTLLAPLACASAPSKLVLRGGTHVEWSPPFDFLVDCYLPTLRRMGFRVEAELRRWGWRPVGGGEIVCRIAPFGAADGRPSAIGLMRRGSLRRIRGRAVAANLSVHIGQRMTDRALAELDGLGVPIDIEVQTVSAACPGAGIFLTAEYEELTAAFSSLGRLGKPSETVADEAVAAFREHHESGAAVDVHLADQLLLPLAFAAGPSVFTVAEPTGHLLTNAWTIGQFGAADITIEDGAPKVVRVAPRATSMASTSASTT